MYLKAAAAEGIAVTSCIAVEDSASGVGSAANAEAAPSHYFCFHLDHYLFAQFSSLACCRQSPVVTGCRRLSPVVPESTEYTPHFELDLS